MRYAQTQRARGVPLDTINALRVFSFPALPLVGHQKECMNEIDECNICVNLKRFTGHVLSLCSLDGSIIGERSVFENG